MSGVDIGPEGYELANDNTCFYGLTKNQASNELERPKTGQGTPKRNTKNKTWANEKAGQLGGGKLVE